MGGEYVLPTKKSGTEDVDMIFGTACILCDAKIFRLGRSQKAPNVKDFLKLESVKTWIANYKKNSKLNVVGGLIAYPSLFEWETNSEVYLECTTAETPVIMLSYELMAILLEHKSRFKKEDFLNIWNYKANQLKRSDSKANYNHYVTSHISRVLDLPEQTIKSEVNKYRSKIIEAVNAYKDLIESSINDNKIKIEQEVSQFSNIEDLKRYTVKRLLENENKLAYDYCKNIKKFRKY